MYTLYQQICTALRHILLPAIGEYLYRTRGWQVDFGTLFMPATVVRMNKHVTHPNLVYIGRSCYQGGWKLPKSPWHNPYPSKQYPRHESIGLYASYLKGSPELLSQLPSLYGCTLGCWCKPEACHGDVLISMLYR